MKNTWKTHPLNIYKSPAIELKKLQCLCTDWYKTWFIFYNSATFHSNVCRQQLGARITLWSSCTNYVAICFHHIYFSVGSHGWLGVQQTLCGPQLTCVWGSRDKNIMRSPVKASRVSSVKCQWNVKCLSRTPSTVCRLEVSHVSWIMGFWRITPSTYQLPSSFLSDSQQASPQACTSRELQSLRLIFKPHTPATFWQYGEAVSPHVVCVTSL